MEPLRQIQESVWKDSGQQNKEKDLEAMLEDKRRGPQEETVLN